MNTSTLGARPAGPAGERSGGPAGSHFAVLGLAFPLVRAIVDEGYDVPTPVQRCAVPAVLDGRDLFACAQTGTGKTAAFLLPVLQRLAAEARYERFSIARNDPSPALAHTNANGAARTRPRPSTGSSEPRSMSVTAAIGRGAPRALVLSPTRELAAQIAERAAAYGRHLGVRHTVIYGGSSQRSQELALRQGIDLLIATPGRLLDLVAQRVLALDDVRTLVLDEADRLLDMGFVNDVRRILRQMPRREQTLLFSATMPAPIRQLVDEILREPIEVLVSPDVTAAPSVSHLVWHVPHDEKRALVERVLSQGGERRAIVFTRTKRGANRVCERLVRSGFQAGAIHGNKSQNARERVLDAFRDGTTRVLVATDVAARGIDVEDIGLVVNYDLPNVAESYVHRIGRTGRAGRDGAAVSFCDHSERPLLADIERLLRFRIPVAGSTAGLSPRVTSQPARRAVPARRGRLARPAAS